MISTPSPKFAQVVPAQVIGLMSGTSLDGVDLCACTLSYNDQRWSYVIEATSCYAYPSALLRHLEAAFAKTRSELQELDEALGEHYAELINNFCQKYGLSPDLIASHGHTVHHRPAEGYTLQLGSPEAIARGTSIATIGDFRSLDVSLGGQGAPLVPIVDRLLFGEYAQCLNLGGIANVSYEHSGERIAYDITFCNQVLNRLALQLGLPFDEGGQIAASGKSDQSLIKAICALPFHDAKAPKSLGREWVEETVWPLVASASLSPQDKLASVTSAVGQVLAKAIQKGPIGNVLVTGGGAYNDFLLSKMTHALGNSKHEVVVPAPQLVEYKEALAFALLGALHVRGDVNTLRSVTGATRDSTGGHFSPAA